jgi:hypothetical protein
MRLNRITTIALTLAALTVALALPAAAGVGPECKKVYAFMETTVVEDYVEIGPVEGSISGVGYLRYEDAAPPINSQQERPNLVITSKIGDINLWVYSALKPDGGDSWWRRFEILRAEGTGSYAGMRIILDVYGKCTAKSANYEIEGMICTPPLLPPKR